MENWEQIFAEAWWYLVHEQPFEPRENIEDEENLKIIRKRQKTSQKKKNKNALLFGSLWSWVRYDNQELTESMAKVSANLENYI